MTNEQKLSELEESFRKLQAEFSAIQEQFFKLQAQIYTLKANERSNSVNQFKKVAMEMTAIMDDDTQLQREIEYLLNLLCIPFHSTGFAYLTKAIFISVHDISCLNQMVNILYPKISKVYEISPAGVEKSIRTAIGKGWDKVSPDILIDLFGNKFSIERTPTNKKFILAMVDLLKFDYLSD